MSIPIFLLVCFAAAIYVMILGTAAAGERVPVITTAWELIRRPVEWLERSARRRGESR